MHPSSFLKRGDPNPVEMLGYNLISCINYLHSYRATPLTLTGRSQIYYFANSDLDLAEVFLVRILMILGSVSFYILVISGIIIIVIK